MENPIKSMFILLCGILILGILPGILTPTFNYFVVYLLMSSPSVINWYRYSPSLNRVIINAPSVSGIVLIGVQLIVAVVLMGNFCFARSPFLFESERQPFSLMSLIGVLVLGPLVEELYYRSFLWDWIGKVAVAETYRFQNLIRILGTSLVFGIYHLGFWNWEISKRSGFHVISAFLGGLIFSSVKQVTGELKWSIAVHQVGNIGILLLRSLK